MIHNTKDEIIKDETNRIYVATKEYPDGELLTSKEVSDWHYQELQKAREQWLREEIVKLEGVKDYGLANAEGLMDDLTRAMKFEAITTNKALQTIIDRYQSELDQSN